MNSQEGRDSCRVPAPRQSRRQCEHCRRCPQAQIPRTDDCRDPRRGITAHEARCQQQQRATEDERERKMHDHGMHGLYTTCAGQ